MNFRIITVVTISLVLGFLIGNYTSILNSNKLNSIENCESKYSFINNKIGCTKKIVIKKHEYVKLNQDINSYIAYEKSRNHIHHISVYFRDLHAGPTLGIQEQARFAPASLLKVPLLISYLELAEKEPDLLNKKIIFKNSSDIIEQTSTNSSILKENNQYTVDELLSYMIVQSDNTAYAVLLSTQKILYPKNSFQETLLDLGLISPRTPTEDTITVKAYSSLFRHLYNSSFLSPEMSEKALGLLQKSEFHKGLVAGVPSGTIVAHKFGERDGLTIGEKQLHDCGIIYYPGNPYLLCVMTRGDNFDELAGVIKTVSEKVYKEVDSRKE